MAPSSRTCYPGMRPQQLLGLFRVAGFPLEGGDVLLDLSSCFERMSMNAFTRAYYEAVFERDFLKKTANQFQDFFAEIMEKCHPGDFIRTRPWGTQGDRKNDGYLKSERTLFQVYAPNAMREEETLTKIDEDYWGALPYWQAYFNMWIFAHNARNGLGPGVERRLLDLDLGHTSVRVRPWGFEELRQRTFRLKQTDLASLLGPVPSRQDVIDVKFQDLELVLLAIAQQPVPPNPDLRPVSPRKLAANGLSSWVHILLSAGMVSSVRVKQFFTQYHDPTLGDRVVQAFQKEYEALRDSGQSPDAIFVELQTLATGAPPASPQRQAAVLSVLAYLFEECDIFERPREELSHDPADQAAQP